MDKNDWKALAFMLAVTGTVMWAVIYFMGGTAWLATWKQ